MIVYKNCKHMLPCGWCELRKMMCPNVTPSWQNTVDCTVARTEESDGCAD